VSAGRLTQAQADAIESDLQQRITEQVNGTLPDHPSFRGGYGGHGLGPDDDGGGPGQPGGGGSGTFGGTATA
jgi:hypothetical protein